MRLLRAALRIAVAAAALSAAAIVACAQEAESPPSVPAVQPFSPDGQRISSVRVLTEEGRLLEENPSGFPVAAGQVFDSAAVAEGLRHLFRRGRYQDVRAEAVPAAAGDVRLDYIVALNFYINKVRMTGLPEKPTEGAAFSALQLELGHVFREADLPAAIQRLRLVLAEEGYYRPQIASEITPNHATRQMDVLVRVVPGEQARIGRVSLSNASGFPDKTLLDEAKLKSGKRVTAERLERAARNIRNHLVKKGLLTARVEVRRGEYDEGSNSLPLGVEVFAGLKVRVEVTGAKISDRMLRQLLPIYQEGAVDEDLLQEGRRNIRAHLEQEGYFDAQVSYTVGDDEQSGFRVIRYAVQLPPRSRLVGVEFAGNRYFSSSLLAGRLRILPASFSSSGRFSRRLLEEDAASVREMYAANGFAEARVTSQVVENYRGKKNQLFVRFQIEEGPQTRVASLKLEGNAALGEEVLLAYVDSQPRQPYSEYNVTGDRNNILALYYNEGFAEARVEARAEPAAQANRMNLTYRISEGPQTRVAQVLIDGYQHTRLRNIRRQVTIEPEGPLRQGEVVETQRRLYDLGIFSRVRIAPQNPQGSDLDKTIVVMVDEAKRYTLAYGGGIEFQRIGSSTTDPAANDFRFSPRGLFEISKTNLTGRGDTLALKLRASTLQSRALLSYSTPNFLDISKNTFLLTALADDTQDVQTFRSQRYEISAQVVQRQTPFTTVLYRYSFRRVVVDPDSLQIPPQQVPLFSQPTKVSGPGLTWIRDRRDNPAEAARGTFDTVDLSVAIPPMGSSAGFVRLFAQNSSYHKIGRSFVFARATRLGVQEPFGDSTPDDIPLPERFFSGGGSSLRGFGLNQAGPRDPTTGFPVGGLALLVFNQELRFPMRLPFVGERVGGALFYDAGSVFTRTSKINLRWQPKSPAELNYFSHTIGFAFRYATPVGPVRLDLGYLLNPAEFSFVDANNVAQLKRLPRFQFFVNFGSVF